MRISLISAAVCCALLADAVIGIAKIIDQLRQAQSPGG